MACAQMIQLIAAAWIALGPGAEYAAFDGIHVVRVDPARVELRFGLATRDGGARTAKDWADQQGFVAVINAGMFDPGGRSTGYLRDGPFVLNKHWNLYRSALAFRAGAAEMLDLDVPAEKTRTEKFTSVVQNLRLIKSPGEDVWGHATPRRWSEAAVAQDDKGRLLLLFSRAAYTMSELNRRILALPLGVVRAMHVEGGPEASLSVRGVLKMDLAGSHETGFQESDEHAPQVAIPNVIGVRLRR